MNDHPSDWWSTALGWVALVSATVALHLVAHGALRPPPLSSAHDLANWWHQRGPLLATFAAARELLWWIGCYLLLLSTLAALTTWGRSDGVIRNLLRWRLPGTRTVVRASIGVSALGATLLSNAAPGVARGEARQSGRCGHSRARPRCCATPARLPGIPRAAVPRQPPQHCGYGPAAGGTEGRQHPGSRPNTGLRRPGGGHAYGQHIRPCCSGGRRPGHPDARPGFPATAGKQERGRPDARHGFPTTAHRTPAGQTSGPGSQPPPTSPASQTPGTGSRPPPATTGQGRAPTPVATSGAGVPASSPRPVKLSPLTPYHLAPLSRPVDRAATSDGGAGPAPMWRVSPGTACGRSQRRRWRRCGAGLRTSGIWLITGGRWSRPTARFSLSPRTPTCCSLVTRCSSRHRRPRQTGRVDCPTPPPAGGQTGGVPRSVVPAITAALGITAVALALAVAVGAAEATPLATPLAAAGEAESTNERPLAHRHDRVSTGDHGRGHPRGTPAHRPGDPSPHPASPPPASDVAGLPPLRPSLCMRRGPASPRPPPLPPRSPPFLPSGTGSPYLRRRSHSRPGP